MRNKDESEKGQASLIFVVSMVIVIAAIALLVDGGRYLVMRNRARMMADATALSAASILDLEEASNGNFVLDWSGTRDTADAIFSKNLETSPEYAEFELDEVRVQGNQIWVTVTGRSAPLFGSQWGLNYSTTIVSSARAATGISGER